MAPSGDQRPGSAGSSSEKTVNAAYDSEVPRNIAQLARTITGQSLHAQKLGDDQNPFGEDVDPRMDPRSGKFDYEAWIRSMLDITSRDPERYPNRTAGVSFTNLNVHGYGTAADHQKTVGNVILDIPGMVKDLVTGEKGQRIDILRDFDGLVKQGEMLVVLGPPGSGCTTLLKTIAGETHGFYVDEASNINYQGIPLKNMHRDFRGEVVYNAETDVHFPNLTVGETLTFAAKARTPRTRMPGVTRDQYASHMKDVVMAIFGLSHTENTKVGNDFIRGVSGGERKRVSIAEVTLSGAPLQCWDNSTRGLDSATAMEFVKTVRLSTRYQGATSVVAIYQASQDIYDLFDKVTVLYEGRQMYFGGINDAKKYFVDMGFECPDRQTTADFLTSLTNPAERKARAGFEHLVPKTPEEFYNAWKESPDRKRLLQDIDEFNAAHPTGGESFQKFQISRKAQKSRGMRSKSPYTLSFTKQVQICLDRGFQRLKGDLSLFFTSTIGNFVMALIIASVFFNLENNTASFYSRGALLFYAVLIAAFSSALEILSLYEQRPIVEKHSRMALYHPASEAIAAMICDLPSKILTSLSFNLALYFMTNLRREAGPFFLYLLFSFLCTLCMSMIFRTIGSSTRTISQAMAPAAIIILALVIYTGFTIPPRDMVVWFRWINYINPIAYAFETLMVNEFDGQNYPCTQFIPSGPSYENASGLEHICSSKGAVPGSDVVEGTAYLATSFEYYRSHVWRNFGILIGFMVFFCATHLLTTEYITAAKSKGEVLVFRRSHIKQEKKRKGTPDAEAGIAMQGRVDNGDKNVDDDAVAMIQRQTAIFHWEDVVYDIKIKGEPRRLLNKIDGWVEPGKLTALMGASGAGKTTLLDVLASRVTMGVVSGDMFVDGLHRDSSFQRKTGYVQQQDLHLETSTVREALTFSARLRQARTVPDEEKLAYVEEVIRLLNMEAYADAVVGVPGEGLNVEQRKRLTIGVELVAKPALLLFLDEPTSGLDSQTAWSICTLLRKLANNGQAILCTIHQPSALLFQEFDRLLFLQRGGQQVYFGDIGKNSRTLIDYFEGQGAPACPSDANPAEWMLHAIGAAPGAVANRDFAEAWRESKEYAEVKRELAVKRELSNGVSPVNKKENKLALAEFAATPWVQFTACAYRVFQQYWRTPSYIYSKFVLCFLTALFIGFSFYQAENTIQGLQNQMFSIFMLLTIFGNLVNQIMPHFVTQRSLYEVRERPSKTYSWQAFMAANIVSELPWNSLMAVIMFVSWYYPIGLYRNAEPTDAVHERGALMFLLVWAFLMFTSTFTHMIIAGIDLATTGGNVATLLFSLCLIFCGVLATPDALPGFWIFMYRVSPFTYLVDAMLSVSVANTFATCSDIEMSIFDPPSGKTCGEYLEAFQAMVGGSLANPEATSDCNFCAINDTNVFLAQVFSKYEHRWRNFGLLWVYILFNIAGAFFLYWLARVPKGAKARNV